MNNPPSPYTTNNGNHNGWDNPNNPHSVPIDTPILSSLISIIIIFFVYLKFKKKFTENLVK